MKTRIFLIVLFGLLLVPFPTQIVPEWSLTIIDQNGEALKNTSVEQTCSHYSYSNTNVCGEALDARQRSDGNGFVYFSPKTVWYSALSRLLRGAYHYVLIPFHGSIGKSGTLFIHSEFNLDPSVINLDKGPPANGKVVVNRSE